jgi:hypothetical protein
MKKYLHAIVTAIFLFLIIATFNPFFSPGLYFDSTGAYRFLALHKITLLTILNILLAGWSIYRIYKKDLFTKLRNLDLLLIVFLIPAIISFLLSINKLNSLYGVGTSLESSLIEISNIIILTALLVINFKEELKLQIIIRGINTAISLTSIWFLFRYASTWSASTAPFKDFFNSLLFSLSGHISSLLPLTLLGMILGAYLIFNDIKDGYNKIKYIDIVNLIITGAAFTNLLNLWSQSKDISYLLLSVLAFGFIAFTLYEQNKKEITYIGCVLLISILTGLGIYFGLTKSTLETFNYSSLPLNMSLDITHKSFENNPLRVLFGNGSGNFSYAFDKYKDPAIVPNNIIINTGTPIVSEARINHPTVFLTELLHAYGYVGVLAMLGIIGSVLFNFWRKYKKSSETTDIFFMVLFLIASLSLLLNGYDFSLYLIFFIITAISIILLRENTLEIKPLTKVKEKSLFFITLIVLAVVLVASTISLVKETKLTAANSAIRKAKEAQVKADYDAYLSEVTKAFKSNPESQVFGREYVNAKYVELQRKNNGQNDDEVLKELNTLIEKYPLEYKNYYFAGRILMEKNDDENAIQFFLKALKYNTNHPDTYFQLSILYERKNDYQSALSSIENANRYDQKNIIYKLRYADVLYFVGEKETAKEIYKAFKEIVDQNPSNQQLQSLYKEADIERKLQTE